MAELQDLDPSPVSRARLAVVEPALFEWDVFEMAAPILSPAKCEVRSVKRFLNAKDERSAEIHKQIVAITTYFFSQRNISLGKSSTTMMRCKKKSSRGSLLWLGDTEAASKT
jgi:hypothetical protein